MNERIKEIALVNGIIHEHMSEGEKHDTLKRCEKFAKIIIGECTNLRFPSKLGISREQEYGVHEAILEHFGII